jgi:integrase
MKLTEKYMTKLVPQKKRVQIMDDGGFGLRVEPNGRKVFIWYAKVHGKPQLKSLGEFPSLSPRQARDLADMWSGRAASWKTAGYPPDSDPFKKEQISKPATAPKFKELLEAYIVQHVRETANRPERAETHLRWLAKKYLNDWTERPIDEITVKDAVALKNKIVEDAKESKRAKAGTTGGRIMANRVIEKIRAIFNWSAKSRDGKVNYWPVENPAKSVALFDDEEERDRYIEPHEMVIVHKELKKNTSRDLRDFLLIGMFTGARKENILSAEWDDVNFETDTWKIPLTKTGDGYTLKLTPSAKAVFKRRDDEKLTGAKFVFPSDTAASGHRVDVKKEWQMFRVRAGIPDVRLHDAGRRTRGSYMAMAGASLPTIGAALGHAPGSPATEIYARLHPEHVAEMGNAGETTMYSMMAKAKRRTTKTARREKLADRKPKLLKAAR